MFNTFQTIRQFLHHVCLAFGYCIIQETLFVGYIYIHIHVILDDSNKHMYIYIYTFLFIHTYICFFGNIYSLYYIYINITFRLLRFLSLGLFLLHISLQNPTPRAVRQGSATTPASATATVPRAKLAGRIFVVVEGVSPHINCK